MVFVVVAPTDQDTYLKTFFGFWFFLTVTASDDPLNNQAKIRYVLAYSHCLINNDGTALWGSPWSHKESDMTE